MPATTIFNGALTNAFQPSRAIMVSSERVVLDFLLSVANVAGGVTARIEWYPEFTWDNPNSAAARWFRETAEDDVGDGDIEMPKTARHFEEVGGADLALGTHSLDGQFKRSHDFCRIQIRVAAGGADTCVAQVFSAYGKIP